LLLFVVLFFFFQAEDGIRDFHVTGVQTCALPISLRTFVAALAVYHCCWSSMRYRRYASLRSVKGRARKVLIASVTAIDPTGARLETGASRRSSLRRCWKRRCAPACDRPAGKGEPPTEKRQAK